MNGPRSVTRASDLREELAFWRRAGETVALVPTMGALHEGHLSLVAHGRRSAARTIVSIFVNPTQFAPEEDFGAYPRTLEADLEKLGRVGVDLVFAPNQDELYPPGFATTVLVGGPAAAGLEDRFRPSHFAGVATIVAKLLILTHPDQAVFGEKDFQQLAVIRRLVRDLDIPAQILGVPIVRESDGLAMSSRNAYLSAGERETAPILHREMERASALASDGVALAQAVSQARERIEQAGFAVDYLELRDSETLGAPNESTSALRLLAAARLGRTRLIDNIAWPCFKARQ